MRSARFTNDLVFFALIAPGAIGMAALARGELWGLPLALVALAAIAFRVVVRRQFAALLEATERNDLDALEAMARSEASTHRLPAILAFLHHGGFDRDEARVFCDCGACDRENVEEELDEVRHALRLAWSGHAPRALQRVRQLRAKSPKVCRTLKGFVEDARATTATVCVALALAARPGDDRGFLSRVLPRVESTAYRWPVRLAAALEAEARNQPMLAREYLKGMPAWPRGSRLEQARAALKGRLYAQ